MDSNAVTLTGTHLIEASAGTGKTFAIAHLYTRLVIGHRHPGKALSDPLSPQEILVMTFTTAATLELRDRCRKRLVEAAILFDGGTSSDPALVALRDGISSEEHRLCKDRLQAAAEMMDEAAIYTIHGWCLNVLKRYTMETGLPHGGIAATDSAEIYDQVVHDSWRHLVYPLKEEEVRLLKELFPTPGSLKSKLKMLSSSRQEGTFHCAGHPLKPITDVPSVLRPIMDALKTYQEAELKARKLWLDHRDELRQLLLSLRDVMNKSRVRPAREESLFRTALAQLDLWAQDKITLTALLDKDGGKLSNLRSKLTKGNELPEHDFFTTFDEACIIGEAQWQERITELFAQITVHVHRDVTTRFAAEKQRHRIVDFNDMLTLLDSSLANSESLARRVHGLYPVALVDEFQDTDPVQYRILRALYQQRGTLMLIGDPKQAIYRFRGADIATYLTARGDAQQYHSLPVNWRSTKELVEAVNTTFSHAEEWDGGAFLLGKEKIPFHPVAPRENADHGGTLLLHGKPHVAMEILLLNPPLEWINLTKNHYKRGMAAACAEKIDELLHSAVITGTPDRPVVARDIAVLVRNWGEAQLMQNALSRLRIPAVPMSSRTSVFSSEEANDILLWLHALISPQNIRKIRNALATSSMGFNLEELLHLTEDDERLQEHQTIFSEARQRWRNAGVLSGLRYLMQQDGATQRLLRSPKGERRLSNLLHLSEWLQQAEQTTPGAQDLVHLLERNMESPEDNEEQVLRLESERSAVQLITYHGSKGLQYPIVFVPFTALYGETEIPAITTFQSDDEMITDLCFKDAPEEHKEAYRRESLSEELRLLYVAMTRPEYALFLGTGPVGRGKDHSQHRSAFGYILDGLRQKNFSMSSAISALTARSPAIQLQSILYDPDALSADEVEETTGEREILFAPRHAEPRTYDRWWISSFSAFVASHSTTHEEPETRNEQGDEVIDPGEEELLDPLPPGARTGTLLHDLIEAVGRQGFVRLAVDQKARHAAVTRYCQRTGSQEYEPILQRWITEFLATPIASGMPAPGEIERFRLELEFLFPLSATTTEMVDSLIQRHLFPGVSRPSVSPLILQGMMKGFIDLLFVHNQRYHVADWKSNTLGSSRSDYTTERMIHAIAQKRYDIQIAIYNVALHRHLTNRMPGYDPSKHLGPTVYTFLRGAGGPDGSGVVIDVPLELIQALNETFQGQQDA